MKKWFTFLGLLTYCVAAGQVVSLSPTISPSVFGPNDQITVTYNVTGTAFANISNAWIWIWIPGKSIGTKYNINPASSNPSLTDNAKFTKNIAGGTITFTKTFIPADLFTSDISSETQLGMLLKANDWVDGAACPCAKTIDYVANFGFRLTLSVPNSFPAAVLPGGTIYVQATAPVAADFNLYVNNVLVDTKTNLTSYNHTHVVDAAPTGTVKLSATAVSSGALSEVTFSYIIKLNSPEVSRPTGIVPGINYNQSDDTKVTLCLWAPGKTSAYIYGDFSDWDILPANLMNRDGEYFWIELSGLTSGEEYGYQYWVDGTLRLADAFADKILDPDDQYISDSTYPNLKVYPPKALSTNWYNNRVAVFQTNQSAYAWQKLDFQRPKKESLVIYELLLRDYFATGQRNYQTLIDTISYLKRLGVNAIELMPIMEFNGNESWGYNPSFMFAPDKYYGTKNKFKEFIDQCHINGIAVILDIAMNHQDTPNPMVMLDFDINTFKPTANNKWFNVNATHPFSVFYDMNHESAYTKKYLDTVNYYWLNEYKVDGFRFDLSKGFTQTNNPTDVGIWSEYDGSRIAILKRMADKIWSHSPNAYIILEHLAVNSEEKELAEYRVGEGKGMMLWGNLNHAYNQNTMGFNSGSDISGVYHGSRSWSAAHLVGYMESHDEERLLYRNLQFGNTSGAYTTKDLNTALQRIGAASLLFYTVPGPKMLWQFGELGFDMSINRCENGTISNDCRLSIKPTVWEYLEEYGRFSLFEQTADLIRLKKGIPAFQDGTAIFSSNGLVKQVIIKNKLYTATPTDSTQMSAVVVANFELQSSSVVVNFPHSGTWYNYYSGESLNVTGTWATMTLSAGSFKMFTNVQLVYPVVTSIRDSHSVRVYPNPVSDFLTLDQPDITDLVLYGITGTRHKLERVGDAWDVRAMPAGLYVGTATSGGTTHRFKVLVSR